MCVCGGGGGVRERERESAFVCVRACVSVCWGRGEYEVQSNQALSIYHNFKRK